MTKGTKRPAKKTKPPATRSTSRNKANASATIKPSTKASTSKRRAEVSDSEEDDSESTEEVPHRRSRKRPRVDDEVEDVMAGDDDDEPDVEVVGGEASNAEDDEGNDGLQEKHTLPMPSAQPVKKESTKDLLLIMSDKVTVRFMNADKTSETVRGRWCSVCKEGAKAKGLRAAFLTGANSSCRQHIRQHYELYKAKCKEADIPVNHWAIPRDIWREMQAEKEAKAKLVQKKIEFGVVSGPKEFTRDGILQSVTKFITVDDQSLAVASKPIFRNCLVTMRPKTTNTDLPSTHEVLVNLHNKFTVHMAEVRESILKAPGKVSVTDDLWSEDYTKSSFKGMSAHWIEVVNGKWRMRTEVIAFQAVSGDHSGLNLGRYFVGCCDRVGIMGKNGSKLQCATLDNTSSNTTLCETVENIHKSRGQEWSAEENQLPCCAHVVNLGNVDIMRCVTKIAAVETATAIWEYDPTLPDNRVLGGSLDVIAAIRTLAIKIQASGQRIEYFEQCQTQCGQTQTFKIPLHSNIRWGTAHKMLERAYQLRQAIALFLSAADELFGPITTIRVDGRVSKHIPWSAFKLQESDWTRVIDAKEILADSNRIQQYFSSESEPTLWRVLPALEELQTHWEEKKDDPHYALYASALDAGLQKLKKYYLLLDTKPVFVLALALHPYYKLAYIEHAWGGENEQQDAIAKGDLDAKNWQDEAQQIVENTMRRYWSTRPRAPQPEPQPSTSSTTAKSKKVSDFDLHRKTLLAREDQEGYQAELRRYLNDVPAEVTKDTDVVVWWQDNHQKYPTLGRMALDILPAQASSIPCERLFSGSKQTADARRTKLGAKVFEELQIMKYAWRRDVSDFAAMNSRYIEEIDIHEYTDMLEAEKQTVEWECDVDEEVAV
ncbi:hypothetical protein LshimejAT787_0605810 [Lyophyllum shimeji]|uniref:HAT C-terminal dimerisation domain-containing protein n=1 Tax=Lyophyllum shimeji TaxID=47721 RepID=A0A9P3PPZ3_LYOSH|nr:hypothetical protein LshimejAT787_0605810 [Lyophyllum shimeji]